MATHVPSPTFTDAGFVPASGPDVLAGVEADINEAFGNTLNFALTTPQGQLATSEAAVVENNQALFCYYANQVDPATASGRMQDAIARIYDIERLPSEPTALTVQCNGLPGVVIPVGATLVDSAGNLFGATDAGTIGVDGLLTLQFACTVPGPTTVPAAVTIYQAIPGWDSAAVLSGTVGQDVETRAAFEARRQQSVAKNAVGSVPSVLGAVLSVSGVLDAYVVDNPLRTNAVRGGVTLNPNSLYVAAVGGSDQDVADAIWSKKSPGCAYNGNTTVNVFDTVGYDPPYPDYQVSFERPASLAILFAVSIVDSAQVPSNAETLIQNALLAAFAGQDGGQRARIGSLLLAFRYSAPIQALGAWAQIASLQIGSDNTKVAQIVASIAANTMTVTGVSSGTLAVGQTISDAAGVVAAGTRITGFVSGSGGVGTYTVGVAQTVGSRTMLVAKADQNSVQAQIDQEPTLSAADIVVSVT